MHGLTRQTGEPVEVFFSPGSTNETKALRHDDFNLPEGATVYGEKAYNEYFTEDLLDEAAGIDLLPLRKKNSKRQVSACLEYVQHTIRKRVETSGSQIKEQFPASIHAVTAAGFELKVFLFVLVFSIDCLL